MSGSAHAVNAPYHALSFSVSEKEKCPSSAKKILRLFEM